MNESLLLLAVRAIRVEDVPAYRREFASQFRSGGPFSKQDASLVESFIPSTSSIGGFKKEASSSSVRVIVDEPTRSGSTRSEGLLPCEGVEKGTALTVLDHAEQSEAALFVTFVRCLLVFHDGEIAALEVVEESPKSLTHTSWSGDSGSHGKQFDQGWTQLLWAAFTGTETIFAPGIVEAFATAGAQKNTDVTA